MSDVREIKESPIRQGVDESIAYTLTVTPWGSTPTAILVKAYDITTGAYTDVTSTVLTGAASANGDVITLPVLASLTDRSTYRLEVKFTCSGNVFEAYAVVKAEK